VCAGAGFRTAAGNPVLLEDVLVRHPKLRLFVENAGYPYRGEMIAMMYQYPQLHADVSTISWFCITMLFASCVWNRIPSHAALSRATVSGIQTQTAASAPAVREMTAGRRAGSHTRMSHIACDTTRVRSHEPVA
jgi:hypothetical protein